MSGARPSVAVLVPTYDRPALLPDCLAAIAAELGAGDELWVAEGGDSRAADAIGGLTTAARVEMVHGPGGKAARLNVALGQATTELLLFTDDDCRVPRGWVAGLAAPFADPQVAIAFGPVAGLTHLPGSHDESSPPPGEAPFVPWTYAHGSSMALRRDAVAAIGGFDARLGPGSPVGAGEDHDVLVRLREQGWTAVIADAPAVGHLDWRDAGQDADNALVYERGSGAYLGTALRRGVRRGWPLLKHRLGYARQLVAERRGADRRFAWRATRAFAGGLLYGLRLPPWRG
jgi:GT2 family glycosyltransferase